MALTALTAIPLLASLVLSYRADSGTVYVAADSRLTPTTPVESARTSGATTCKIRVLNDGVVFVGTGNALFSTRSVRTDIYAVAADAASTLDDRPLEPADIRRVALAWQTVIHTRLQTMLHTEAANGRHTLIDEQALSTTGTTGSFFAATASGEVYGLTLRVAVGPEGALQNIEEPEPQPGYLVATGTNEAKHNALAIAAQMQNANIPWPRRLQAIETRSIHIAAQRYGRRSEIGGPIDMIEITPKGPLWLARKSSCR